MLQNRKTLASITLSIPIALFILHWLARPLGHINIGWLKQKTQPSPVIYPSKTATRPPESVICPYGPPEDWRVRYSKPLRPISAAAAQTGCSNLEKLGLDAQLWGEDGQQGDKLVLLKSIDNSLQYLQSDGAVAAYKGYRVAGMTRDRVLRSVQRFRELVLRSSSPAELQAAVKREFVFYQSVGKDGLGNVLFTAYYEPVYAASRVPTKEYRYPIYRRPPNLESWPRPHPTREELEGKDGLQAAKGRLKGLELYWLRDRLEAFMIQIQGSGRLQFSDGTETTVGYAGNTAHPYTSIGRELAKDGKLPLVGMTMPVILEYFKKHPADLNIYVPRDRSFVFFQDNKGAPAMGSLSVPVTADRSIATDKSLMPPGALALIHAAFPFANADGKMEHRVVSRYVLDQDTGGAIQGPGRVDYFVGTGKVAGERSGVTANDGRLYYLLLKQ